jgi:DNA polymerase family A
VRDTFDKIAVIDFEYEVADDDLPRPLCMVARLLDGNLAHLHTIKLWRDELERMTAPPFDVGPDVLVAGYSLWAEMTCFQVLGWRFPTYLFDQHTCYLAASNILLPYDPDTPRQKQSKGLSAACAAYGIEGWERIDKPEIARAIGEGRWREYGKDAVLGYCAEDVVMSVKLLRAQLRRRLDQLGHTLLAAADTERVIWWSEYSAKAVAQIQARGMPIDVELWHLVQENKRAVIGNLCRQFDPSYGSDAPIFDADGHWALARFEHWLVDAGVHSWPRLDSGRLDTEGDTFRLMSHVPGVAGIHALRDSIRVISGAKLPIGSDGRNRPSIFPFCTVTGRNAHSKSLYNAHAGMRPFMLFPPDRVGGYLDFRTQEVGVAAAASGDPQLIADYASGDVYHGLALMCGHTTDPNPVRWKRENPGVRHHMKGIQLGINYGMGVPSLARGLNRHPVIASDIIERHKRRYPPYWQWRENTVQCAMLDRRIESCYGWPLHLSHSPNRRTLYNFPMQSGGAEMLRLATVRLCAAGVVPIMLVHDGILFEETSWERIEHAREIMLSAGRDVCNGLEIGVDIDQKLIGGARYRDKRELAIEMWSTVTGALRNVGALPDRVAA